MKKPIMVIAGLAAALGAGSYLFPRTEADAGDVPVGFGYGVGELVPDFTFIDVNGADGSLATLGTGTLVIVLRDVECPVSSRYARRLARMEEEYAGRGVTFLYLNASPQDSPEEIEGEIEQFGFDGRYVRDDKGHIARLLKATTTAEVFVIDAARTLRYRGAVDDQYGITFTKPEPREEYLRNALENVLANQKVARPVTTAEGCHLAIDHKAMKAHDQEVTYNNRVSRIIQNNCQTCHRAGGVAPIPFETYEDVNGMRAMIEYVLNEGIMPPWFAEPHIGEWANDRSLDLRDRRDLLAWIGDGAPEGDPADAGLALQWSDGWQLGEPDAVIQIEEVFDVPAEGVVDYQYVYVKTDFPEDRWIEKMEIRPTAPQVTHHALVFVEPPDAKGPRDAKPGEPVFQGGLQGYFAATVPGFGGNLYPAGSAKLLPKGAWLKFQLHYTPNGMPAQDQSMIGLFFAQGPPERVVETASAFNTRFAIPPGAARHEVVGEYTFERPGKLLTFFPHMHVRGAAFRYDMIHPDGREEPILSVPRYDFNWQLAYELKEPLAVEPGTKIRATGWFDNSPENPSNPDPTREIGFGEQTFDEMMIGYFDWIAEGPVSSSGEAAKGGG